jgi:hypothetical protein
LAALGWWVGRLLKFGFFGTNICVVKKRLGFSEEICETKILGVRSWLDSRLLLWGICGGYIGVW